MTATRLLLVTDAVGGVWMYSLELARALQRLGIDAVLAVTGPPPALAQYEEAAGLDVIDTGLPLEWLETDPVALRRAGDEIATIAARAGADIIQTSSAALLAHAELDRPCVAVQHSCVASWWAAAREGPMPEAFQWRRELVQLGLERADAVVAPSIAFAAETSRLYEVPASFVHNGRSRPTSLDLPQGEFVFTAGRLWDEGKNVATLDAAAAWIGAPVQAAGPTEGPNGAAIELRFAQALGSLSEVRLRALFAARPVYASAALYEPFGLSVLEAAQSGCALVLSDIPSYREIWGGAAIFVPPLDERAFATAINDLLEDPDERAQLSQLARARSARYTPERMARGMADIYARLLTSAEMPARLAGAA